MLVIHDMLEKSTPVCIAFNHKLHQNRFCICKRSAAGVTMC